MKKEHVQNLIDEALNSEQFSGLSEPERADAVFDGVMGRVRVVKMRTFWKRISVAASILVLLGVGWWVLVNKQTKREKQQAETLAPIIPAPDKNRAAITLADGSMVYLDSVNIGQQFAQGSAKIIKTADGKLVYSGDAGVQTAIAYNTLTNPRGSRVIDLALADGSHVWLNAGSSIRYPVVFAGKERGVTVSGEAYFEVAHDTNKPFKVSKGNLLVEVLGTHFNVNAYDDEPDIRVTLLEGKVKVSANDSRLSTIASRLLKPGQQAIMTNHIAVTDQINIDQIMAWKNGLFNFEDVNLDEATRQISRWYDVKLIYDHSIPKTQLWGKMSRNTSFDRVLRNLKDIGVNFKLTDKKELIILP
jgi:transmembrane sensor